MERRPDGFWLDSGVDGPAYIGTGERVVLRDGVDVLPQLGGALDALRSRPESADGADLVAGDAVPPLAFRLGLVGWLGYELRGETTGAAVPHRNVLGAGDLAAFLVVDRAAVVHPDGSAELIALGTAWDPGLGAWRDDLAARLRVDRDTASAHPLPGPIAAPPATAVRVTSDADYLAQVRACQAAIHDGEAYQLCLTTEVRVDARPDPLELHRRVRAASPTHHGALLRIGDTTLVSASPERFLTVTPAGFVETSPIKGTRPRSADPAADARLAVELLASDKERAENLMIVDLMRNDLTRIGDPGSVEVTQLLEVESYAQVHQLVSTVRARLRPGLDAVDAIASCFPAGSMTGAPKRRATEILDGLENRARGAYAGAFGYLGVDGAADLAMTIRTIVLDAAGGARVGTGGGITALSVPEEELEETRVKAAPLLAALGVR
ncbi:anthranilate synthase component I family protein [Schumannella soli]|uniref:Anthranilate synthase component I family protein n=2 Tax=Schumannella soli TaxID=2590779 RepID=A0A506Y090_9MICO|nr:anthranilate synthase component I family protein [Schumannella soli]